MGKKIGKNYKSAAVKNLKRRILCGLAGLAALALTACGGGDGEASEKSKEHVYRSEQMDLGAVGDPNEISDIKVMDGRLYITTYTWKEEGGSLIRLISQNIDGTDAKTAEVEAGENTYYSNMSADAEGNYVAIVNDSYEETDGGAGESVWVNKYYLVKLGQTGNELWRTELTGKDPDMYWINNMLPMADGRIMVCDADGMFLFDAQGNKTGEIKLQKELEIGSMYQIRDGSIVVRSYSSEKNADVLTKVNPDTGEISEEYTIPGGSNGYGGLYAGKGFDFYLLGSGSIYAYNLGDTELTELMNFIDSDLSGYYIYNFAAVDENEFYGITDDDTGSLAFMKFTKVDPKDVKDKIVLTLACNGFDWDVRRQVVAFNKSSQEYRIMVEDNSNNNTDEDYTAGLTRLNADIASGKVPDILVVGYSMPIDSYVAKGLFEDLYPFIDKDGDFNREDFFPNVLKAYETDGKLYRLVPSFTVQTVAGKTANVGTESGWSLDDLNAAMGKMPEGTQVFSEMTRDVMLNNSIQMSGSQFINWKTGECHFNTEEFMDLLAFINQFPEQLGDDYYNDSFWQGYDSMWREDKVLLSYLYLNNFESYNYAKKGTFGENITLVGFPVREGNGAAISSGIELAMSAKSKQKEGAWQFLRYFLTEEYQEKLYQWPLSMKQAERLAQEAMKVPTYEDENGNLVEMEQTYMVNGVEIPITPMSREEVDEVIAYVKTVDQLYSYNEALLNIVAEEAAPYFAGQKNAKEVADIIQSRVQIYVNENR